MLGAPARRIVALVSSIALLVCALLAGTMSAFAASSTSSVFLVHGIVGATADVSVDGSVVKQGVSAKDVVGPLDLAAGQHVVELSQSGKALVSARFTVAAGDNLDVVAHRAADTARTPVITVFRNDVAPVGPGKTRLVVSHVAVAPAADIRVDGKPLFRNVANGESLSLTVPAKTYQIDVVQTTSPGAVVLAPVSVPLTAGTLTRVFAIGDPSAKNADALIHTLPVGVTGASAPTSVHTGDGGQAADSLVGPPLAPWTLPGALALVVTAGALGLAAGHRRGARFGEPSRR